MTFFARPGNWTADVGLHAILRSMARRAGLLPQLGRGPSASYEEVERAEHKFYIDYLRNGMTVFDVGANVGGLTLLFSRFVGSGTVYAFEASSSVHIDLCAVVKATGRPNVVVNRVAISDAIGTVELNCYNGPFRAFNSMADRPLADYGVDAGPRHRETVTVTTIDAYCAANGIKAVDLLKIDVEGAELQVLRGARAMLRARRIACVTFEFGQATFDMGNSPAEIATLFRDVDYDLANIIPGEPLFPGGAGVATAQFAMHVARPR